MPDVVLFGATGYTGRLTAHALARRNAPVALAGRNRKKLDELAAELPGADVRLAEVGDVSSLVRALAGARVLISCVGPFVELGDTAVRAALEAGVHYVDSTGEIKFISSLVERDADARAAGIAMAPAMAFDEVPGDVAATLATEGFDRPELILTYAVPSHASSGTIRSTLGILVDAAPFIEDGRRVRVRLGERRRWAPMPPPLGPRMSISVPLAESCLAPRHIDLERLGVYATVGTAQDIALRAGWPVARRALSVPFVRGAAAKILTGILPEPSPAARVESKWTILAEARAGDAWRNVAVSGRDVYGLSGELLAAAALAMARDGYDRTGVLAPTQAVDVDTLQKELISLGASVEVFEPT